MSTLSDKAEKKRVLDNRVPKDYLGEDKIPKKTVIILVFILLIASLSVYITKDRSEDVFRDHEEGAYPFNYEYPSLGELYSWFEELVEGNPHIAKKIRIGSSWEGRNIWAVKVSDEVEEDQPEPSILIDGTIHAREWSSCQVASYFLWRIIDDYDSNETIHWLVDNREIYVVPVVNPDGYHHDGDGKLGQQRYWRKNRNYSTPSGDIGVDLNRNWDIRWDEGVKKPDSDMYRGGTPFSEYEIKNLRDFILEKKIDSYNNLHSYHGDLLIPWGYTSDPCPHDGWYRDMASDMTSMTSYLGDKNKKYHHGQPSRLLNYSSPGGAYDWVYENTGAVSLCYEIYTGGMEGPGFYPPQKDIMDINLDLYDSLVYQTRVSDADLGDGVEDKFPPSPYIIYGNLSGDGSMGGVEIVLRNKDTGEEISVKTDENGYFEFDLVGLTDKRYDEDDKFVLHLDMLDKEITLDDRWGKRIDITIGS